MSSRAARTPVRLAAVLALASAAAVPGCINFQEPEDLGPRKGELGMNLFVTDTSAVTAHVTGRLLRPRGEDGRLLDLADPSLRIFGDTVRADPARDEDFRDYGARWTLTEDALEEARIRIEGPVIRAGGSRVGITLPFLGRGGPDSLALADGSDLRLPLDLGDEAAYGELTDLSWLVVVESDQSERSLLSLRSAGRPPDTLRIARELLDPLPGGSRLTVVFGARMNVDRSDAGLPYEARLDATFEIQWTVMVK